MQVDAGQIQLASKNESRGQPRAKVKQKKKSQANHTEVRDSDDKKINVYNAI